MNGKNIIDCFSLKIMVNETAMQWYVGSNLESFSFNKIFLNKTTEPGIEPSTFRVETSKLNQGVPT